MLTRVGGYASLTDKQTGRVLAECDTFRCNHCNFISHVKVKAAPEDLGGFCGVCAGLVCARCVGRGCDELERKLDRVEKAQDMQRWFLECR